MSLEITAALVKKSQVALAKGQKAAAKWNVKNEQAQKITLQIIKLTEQANELRWEASRFHKEAMEQEEIYDRALDAARLEYTSPLVDMPSEGKARAWESFLATNV